MSRSRSSLTAKPTEYSGHLFRSRTEARWAVVFDALGVAYEYEERGFDLAVGKRRVRGYLPDFYLPDVWGQSGQGVWWEVKGAVPTADEHKLAGALARATGQDCYITSGGVPLASQYTGSRVVSQPGRIVGFHPRARRGIPDSGKPTMPECFCECECGQIGIQKNGLIGRMGCKTSACGPKTLSPTSRKGRATERIQAALIAGRSARFEHGESGAAIPAAPSSRTARTSVASDAEAVERLAELLAEAQELLAGLRG